MVKFDGTVKLDDREMEKLVGRLKKMPRLRIGILASKGGLEKHPESDSGLSMLEIAAIHEFGSPSAHIPKRSFIRGAFDHDPAGTKAMMVKVAQAILRGKITPDTALELLGQWGVAKVQKFLADFPANRLEPLFYGTILKRLRKRSARGGAGRGDKPLIDTGRLRQSVNYEIKR